MSNVARNIHDEQPMDDDYQDNPYAEYGEEYEDEPMFEKTNRVKGVRRVRD